MVYLEPGTGPTEFCIWPILSNPAGKGGSLGSTRSTGQTPLTLRRLGAYGKSVLLCPRIWALVVEQRPAAKRRQAVAQLTGRVHRLQVRGAQLHLPSPTPPPKPHLAAWPSAPRMLTALVCRSQGPGLCCGWLVRPGAGTFCPLASSLLDPLSSPLR